MLLRKKLEKLKLKLNKETGRKKVIQFGLIYF